MLWTHIIFAVQFLNATENDLGLFFNDKVDTQFVFFFCFFSISELASQKSVAALPDMELDSMTSSIDRLLMTTDFSLSKQSSHLSRKVNVISDMLRNDIVRPGQGI